MTERSKVSIRVVSQKRTCANEHKVSDPWVVENKTPEGICLSAFNSLLPSLLISRAM